MNKINEKIPTILIIGAGPGGLTLAHGLCNKNEKKFNIKIFERDSFQQDRWQGSYIALRQQGLQSLLECIPDHMKSSLRKIMPDPIPTSESHEFSVVDEIGNPLIKLPHKQFENVYEFGKLSEYDYFSLMLIYRDKLRDLLLEGLKNIGIKINWGKKCVGYEELENGVYAIFDDGSREYGDILVAADGINSQIRKQKYPELKVKSTGLNFIMTHIAPPKPLVDRFLKVVNNSLLVNSIGQNGESALVILRNIPTFSATANKEPSYTMTISYDYHEARDISANRIYNEEHGGILVDDGKESVENVVNDVKKMILESRPPCELTDILLEMWSLALISNGERPVYLPRRRALRDLDPNDVENWKTSRVTFIGDSAHACTQYFGIGLNIALQDAGDLSTSFMNWDKDGWKTCIENYEKKMKQRGSFFVKVSRYDALSQHMIFKTNFGWWCQKSFCKTLSKFLVGIFRCLYFKGYKQIMIFGLITYIITYIISSRYQTSLVN